MSASQSSPPEASADGIFAKSSQTRTVFLLLKEVLPLARAKYVSSVSLIATWRTESKWLRDKKHRQSLRGCWWRVVGWSKSCVGVGWKYDLLWCNHVLLWLYHRSKHPLHRRDKYCVIIAICSNVGDMAHRWHYAIARQGSNVSW